MMVTPKPLVLVMGVCGCGKSTLGAALAEALGTGFLEGDRLHPPENVARMQAGIPLTDGDRQGWLTAIAAEIRAAARAGTGLVVACSALKRRYREMLRAGGLPLAVIHLHGPREILADRMAARPGHFMPVSLLDSQLETLELPTAEAGAVTLDLREPMPVLLGSALAFIRAE
ncbi:gluconokinase [Niveispirillum fermenti]|uniref:gluconokinase n=1 Tax=Niveispirillum fermenti TaxID=1233113 RepID=UPI003A8575E3